MIRSRTHNFPISRRVKQPQTMTEPPPCLTVGTVHFGSNSSRGVCDDSLIEEVFALMELRLIIFLHITNRAVYIERSRLYMSDKRRRERKPREKRKESMHSINDSDERAHTLRRYLNDRSANERNVDIQCYVFNNDRQAMYHHYQRHLHYNC